MTLFGDWCSKSSIFIFDWVCNSFSGSKVLTSKQKKVVVVLAGVWFLIKILGL